MLKCTFNPFHRELGSQTLASAQSATHYGKRLGRDHPGLMPLLPLLKKKLQNYYYRETAKREVGICRGEAAGSGQDPDVSIRHPEEERDEAGVQRDPLAVW